MSFVSGGKTLIIRIMTHKSPLNKVSETLLTNAHTHNTFTLINKSIADAVEIVQVDFCCHGGQFRTFMYTEHEN